MSDGEKNEKLSLFSMIAYHYITLGDGDNRLILARFFRGENLPLSSWHRGTLIDRGLLHRMEYLKRVAGWLNLTDEDVANHLDYVARDERKRSLYT